MYTINSLESTIRDLFYTSITCAEYDRTSVEAMLNSIDFYALLQAVRHNAKTVHAYTTQGKGPKSFNYRSGDLFEQRATHLYEDFDQSRQSENLLTGRRYELWLLEDMSLAAVACVAVSYAGDEYVTIYREISGDAGDPWNSGLCLDLEELTENLRAMCKPYRECNMPIYEL